MADNQQRDITADEFVAVKDKTTGQVLPDPIPKHWIGTDLAPNVEPATKTEAEDAAPADPDPTLTTSSAPADEPPADPPADTKPRTSRRSTGA